MSKFVFSYFMDYEGGKIARMYTAQQGIPVNIFIDNAADFKDVAEGPCSIDVYGVGSNIQIFPSKDSYFEANFGLDSTAMIPMGTFPANKDEEDFEQSPHILFTGKVLKVEPEPCDNPDDPNYCLLIETLEFEFNLIIRYDSPVEVGSIIYGVAWLFGDLVLEN